MPKSRLGKRLRELHMRHHFQDDEKGFGISAPYWDVVFRHLRAEATDARVRPNGHAVGPVSEDFEDEGEIVDGLPVVAEPRAIEPARPLVPARQAAALAATGFVAGAATVASCSGGARAPRAGAARRAGSARSWPRTPSWSTST